MRAVIARPKLLSALVLAVVTGSLSQAAPAEWVWRRPIRLSAAPGPARSPQLAQDVTSGDLFAIWIDGWVDDNQEILGRRWCHASGTWAAIENLSQSEWEDRDPLLFFDSRGQGLLLWTRRYAVYQGAPTDGTDLVWRAWTDGVWSEEQILLHNDFYLPGTYGLVPVETPDTILLFITWSNGYRAAEYRRGIWSELSPWEYLTFQDPVVNPVLVQVLWGDWGVLHVAAFGENSSQQGSDRYFHDAYYLTYDGSQWSKPFNVSDTDGVAGDLAMAFDGQGRLHFLWSDPDSDFSSESARSAIWERVYEDGAWSPDNVEVTAYNEAQAIADFDLKADGSGNLNLAWSEGILVAGGHTDLDVYYCLGNGTTWEPEEQVCTTTASSRFPSLVASDGGAALTWQEGAPTEGEIYYSRRVSGPLFWTYLPLIQK